MTDWEWAERLHKSERSSHTVMMVIAFVALVFGYLAGTADGESHSSSAGGGLLAIVAAICGINGVAKFLPWLKKRRQGK